MAPTGSQASGSSKVFIHRGLPLLHGPSTAPALGRQRRSGDRAVTGRGSMYGEDDDGVIVLSDYSDEEEGEVEDAWGRGDSTIIDLAGSDEDDMHRELWEEGEKRERGTTMSAKKRTEEQLRSYPGHQWCERRAEAEGWLRSFLIQQDPTDIPFYGELREQTYLCLPCLEEYHLAKEEVLVFLQASVSYGDGGARARGFLKELDLQYVTEVFSQTEQCFDEMTDIPENFNFALYEVLLDYRLLLDETLRSKFTKIMQGLHSHLDLEVQHKKLPGCYFLLAHPDTNIRSWALKLVNTMGPLSLQDYNSFIKPIFQSWYQALEEAYMGDVPQQGGGSEPRRAPKENWTALRVLLEKLDSKDGGMRALLGDFPSLADIILHHADAEESDNLFKDAMRQVTAACLRLFLSKMTYEAWSFTSSYNPDMVFDSIIYQVQRTDKVVPEGVMKSALDILLPFLQSVESFRSRGGRGLQMSYVDRALEALCSYREVKDSRREAPKRYVEAAVCKILVQAYEGPYSGGWPVASSERWAPLLVSCLRQNIREDADAVQAVIRVLGSHARDVVEGKLMDCLDGISNNDQQTSSNNPDFLCYPLTQALCREKPVTELPVIVVEAIMEAQSRLFLIPTSNKELHGAPLKLFRQLVSSCINQAAAFSRLLDRIIAYPDTASPNPMLQADHAARVAPKLIPILVTDNMDVRGSVLRLMSGNPNIPLSFSVVITGLPQEVIKGMWKGAHRVIVELHRVEYHQFFAVWGRLLDLVLPMTEVTKDLGAIITVGADDWWQFIREVLKQGFHRHLGHSGFLSAMVSFFDVFLRLLPHLVTVMEAAVLQRHSTWLPSLVDWLSDPRVNPYVAVQQKVLKVIDQFMRILRSRFNSCDELSMTRLTSLTQSPGLAPAFRAELSACLMNVRSAPAASFSPSPSKPQMFRPPPPPRPKRPPPPRPPDSGKRPADSSAAAASAKRPHMAASSTPSPAGHAASSSSSRQPLRLSGYFPHGKGPLLSSSAAVQRPKPPPPPPPKPRPPPPPASAVAGRSSRGRERMEVPDLSKSMVPNAEDFEVFRHLKELTVQNQRHTKDFRRQLLRWLIDDIYQAGDGLGPDQAKVPTRFRDYQHYVEVFEPLLLEECRCALGKELDDRLVASSGGAKAPTRGPQQQPGEDIVLELERVTQEKDDEDGGLYTLHFSECSNRRGHQSRFSSSSDLFLLRPFVRKKQRNLEEGEVSDDEEGSYSGKGTDLKEVVSLVKEGELPHCLAVVESDEERDPTRASAEVDGESVRMNIFLTPEHEEKRANHLAPHRLRLKTKWIVTCIGNITTSLREFAAMREVQRVRLAPHIIHGGREKAPVNLEILSAEELASRWGKIEGLVQAATGVPEGPQKKEEFEKLQGEIRRFAKFRVSGALLQASKMGIRVNDLRKAHTDPALRRACKKVLDGWKTQIRTERSCYDSKSSSSDQQPGGAAASTIAQGELQRPGCVPTELWLSLCRSYNPPQLRSIAQACNMLYSTTAVTRGQITLLQGPPGTGKTRTIMGLLSAILHASPYRTPLQPTANSGRTTIRPMVRMGGASIRSNRILVCAPSNGAVDEILLRLLNSKAGGGLVDSKGNPFSPMIVRIGQAGQDAPEEIRNAVLENQVENRMQDSMEMAAFKAANEEVHHMIREVEAAWKELSLARRAQHAVAEEESKGQGGGETEDPRSRVRRLEMRHRTLKVQLVKAKRKRWECSRALDAERIKHRTAIIKDSQIVLATLSSSAASHLSDAVTATSYGFGTVVIDEAGQAVEPSTLIPLRYGCRNLILVGDPRQLPATVISPTVSKLGYDLSLFERLERGGHPVHMLTVQYRMHPKIRAFPSQQFYQGKLADAKFLTEGAANPLAGGSSTGNQPPVIMPYHATPYFQPYQVFDLRQGRERKDRTSVLNDEEARFAVQIFKRFQLEYGDLIGSERVGIITPYKSQVHALHRECRRVLGPNYARLLEINTVDGFQGREKDIIIFSCVRADRRVGFLADKRRMNVALTRARRSLFVLGHVDTLCTEPTWRALVEDARTRGCLTDTKGRDFDDVCSMMVQKMSPEERAKMERQKSERVKLPPPPPSNPTAPALVMGQGPRPPGSGLSIGGGGSKEATPLPSPRGGTRPGPSKPPPPPPPPLPGTARVPPPKPPVPPTTGGGGRAAAAAAAAAPAGSQSQAPRPKPPAPQASQGVDMLLARLTSGGSKYVEETAPSLRPSQLKSKLPTAHAAPAPHPSHPPPPASEIYERPKKKAKGPPDGASSSSSVASRINHASSSLLPYHGKQPANRPPPSTHHQPDVHRNRQEGKKSSSGDRAVGGHPLYKSQPSSSSMGSKSSADNRSSNSSQDRRTGAAKDTSAADMYRDSSSTSTSGSHRSSKPSHPAPPVCSGGGGISQRQGGGGHGSSSSSSFSSGNKGPKATQADRLKKVTGQGASFNLLSFMGGPPPQKK